MFETRQQRRRRTIIASVLIIASLGASAYFVFFNSNETTPSATQTVDEALQEVAKDSVTNDVEQVDSSSEESFSRPRVELELPFGWSTIEQDNNTIWLLSPEFTFDTIDNGEVSGYFKVVIREGVLEQDSLYFGRGLASAPSEKLAYTNPATGQRPETYVSIFGLDLTSNFGYFFVNGNFDLDIGESLGADFGDSNAYVISGGYSSDELTDDMATYPVDLEYATQTNVYDQAISIIESLQIL